MNKLMCKGRFHILLRKSRKLKSLLIIYSSESASEWAHEHQNHLLFSHSVAHPQSHQLFLEQGPNSIMLLLVASKGQVPVDEHFFIHVQGMGPGPSFTLPLPTVVLTVTNNWVATWFLLLFYQEVAWKTPAFLFRNSLISTHAQHHRVSAESTLQGLIWCLLDLYSQAGLKIDETSLEKGTNHARISLSLDTRRFGQRTNE